MKKPKKARKPRAKVFQRNIFVSVGCQVWLSATDIHAKTATVSLDPKELRKLAKWLHQAADWVEGKK